MAASRAHSDTLVINTVFLQNFPMVFANITVVHRGTTGTIWVRTDGIPPQVFNAGSPANSDDCYPVLPGQTITFPNGVLTQEPITRSINGTQVQLISDTAIPFTVYAT